MLERRSALEAVDTLLRSASQGHGAALFVVGEAGLGKTTVLEEACRVASAAAAVGVGRGDAMEAALPFGLLTQCFVALGGPDLFDVGDRPLPPVEARARRYRDAVEWLSAAGPVVIAIDDLHWADPESLGLVSFLARRLAGVPVAILATLRPWPPDALEVCRALVTAGCARRSQLLPLTPEAAAELLTGRGGSAPDARAVEWAVAACGGNPLLLEQVGDALAQGDLLIGPGAPATPSGRAPVAFGDEVVLARFAGVGADAVECARAGSALGTRFRCDLAAEIAGVEGGRADRAIDALCRSGVVRPVGGAVVEFVHPLFGQALYEDLAPPLRARLHARAFEVLMARGLHHEAAEAAVRGDLRGDPAAIAVLASIGRGALGSGAPATAAQRLGAAAALAGDRADAALLLDLAEALVACGRSDAIDVCDRALRLDLPPTLRVRGLRTAARALSLGGAHEAAAARFAQAVSDAAAHDPATAVAALTDQALTAWFTIGPRHALPLAERSREIADRVGGAVQQQADATYAFVRLLVGNARGIETLAEHAQPAVVDAADPAELYSYWSRLSLYGNACSMVERLGEADRAFQALSAAATRVGATTAMAGAACNHGYALLRMGRLHEAVARLREGTDLWSLVSPVSSHFDAVGLAYVLQLQGDLEESDVWWERAESSASASVGALQLFLLEIRGHRALREGRAGEASQAYLDLEAVVQSMGMGEPCFPPWGRHAISAHVAAGRDADAGRVVEWLESRSAGLPCRFPRIAAATGRAFIAEHSGHRDAAAAAHRSALALHAGVDLPVEKVETLLEFGAFLRRTGQPAAARELLAEAAALADAIGARWLGGLAVEELHVAGGRRRRSRDPGALTPQEARVAELAGQGRTNRDIAHVLHVSEATVETHLRHVFTKLGVGSRRALMLRTKDPGFPGR